MLKMVLIGLAALLVVLVIVVAAQPSDFHVERSVTMTAPPEAAFAQVNDFRAWRAWSPYEKLDPNLQRSYDGPTRGVGAKYAWVGNKNIGEGRMTIEKSEPSQIGIKLEFFKPLQSTSRATFTFAKTADGNETTWAMDGKRDFIGKAFSLVVDMDKMIGADFERGLSQMKAQVEAAANSPVAATP